MHTQNPKKTCLYTKSMKIQSRHKPPSSPYLYSPIYLPLWQQGTKKSGCKRAGLQSSCRPPQLPRAQAACSAGAHVLKIFNLRWPARPWRRMQAHLQTAATAATCLMLTGSSHAMVFRQQGPGDPLGEQAGKTSSELQGPW